MKRISIQRTLSEAINFLMALLFVIPLGVFCEQFCHYPLFRCCFIPCTAIIGYVSGRISMTKQMTLSMILCGIGTVLTLLVSILLCPGFGLVSVLLVLVSVFFSVFFFFSARKAAYTIYAPMTISGILIHLVVLICCTGFGWGDRVGTFTGAIAICYFLLTLYAFSSSGLRKSMHKGSGAKRVTYPAGMQMGNFLLVTGFILIAAFLSNIHPIFVLFSNGFVYVLRAIVAIFAFIASLFSRRTGSSATTTEEETTAVADSDNIMAVEPKGEASWLTTAVEIFAFICVMLFLVYVAYKAIEKLRENGGRLPAFLQRMKDRFNPVVDEDFVDETESLFDGKQLLAETGKRLKDAVKKVRERPQKIDDFKDNNTKVRFVFQQILKKVSVRDPSSVSKTPNEIFRAEYDGESDFREFMDYYNEAKYSGRDVPEEAVDSARSILKQKL